MRSPPPTAAPPSRCSDEAPGIRIRRPPALRWALLTPPPGLDQLILARRRCRPGQLRNQPRVVGSRTRSGFDSARRAKARIAHHGARADRLARERAPASIADATMEGSRRLRTAARRLTAAGVTETDARSDSPTGRRSHG